MAEKERRIEQFITIQQRTIITRDYETNDEIISKIYPLHEAIERMAKAVYDTFSGCAHITPFEQVEDKYKQGYYKRAEAALNALLEGK